MWCPLNLRSVVSPELSELIEISVVSPEFPEFALNSLNLSPEFVP